MRGGWSGFGMVTVGIHPTDFELNPTKIPPGGVVQNCRILSERATKVLHKLNVANTEYLKHRISRTQKILNSSPLVYYLGTATDKSLSLGHFIIVCPLFAESITIAKKEQLTLRPV